MGAKISNDPRIDPRIKRIFGNLPDPVPMGDAKNREQLLDNLAATEVRLTPAQLSALDEASALPSEYPGWMLEWQNRERRPQNS